MTKRNILKYVHLAGLIMFLGSILAFIVIGTVSGHSENMTEFFTARKNILIMMNILTVPGMFLLVISGGALAAIAGEGTYRARWVYIKVGLSVLIFVFAFARLSPAVNTLMQLAEEARATGVFPPEAFAHMRSEDLYGTINFTAALAAIAVAVIKPWRRQPERRG